VHIGNASRAKKNSEISSVVILHSKYSSKLTSENCMQADTANNELLCILVTHRAQNKTQKSVP